MLACGRWRGSRSGWRSSGVIPRRPDESRQDAKTPAMTEKREDAETRAGGGATLRLGVPRGEERLHHFLVAEDDRDVQGVASLVGLGEARDLVQHVGRAAVGGEAVDAGAD